MQTVLLVMLAPLVQGVIKKVKARLQNRLGAPIWQPYYDLQKYFKRPAVISEHACWLTQVTPYICCFTMVAAGLLLPVAVVDPPLAGTGGLIMLVYLFALARLFTALTALDAGSAFGGMASSREIAMSAIAEPALFLATIAVLIDSKTTQFAPVITRVVNLDLSWLDPAYGLAALAMLIVVIAETGRIPVDNPDTHLELTMIHEGMLLEYSGRYLGLMLLAAQIKQLLILTLFIDLFFPWGIALEPGLVAMLIGISAYLLKLLILSVVLALIETAYAKIRLFKIPKLLTSSMALSLLAIIVGIAK